MKYFVILIATLLLYGCESPCESCKVIKNGVVIEKYESCDEEGKKLSRSVCKEMAEMQKCECECTGANETISSESTK